MFAVFAEDPSDFETIRALILRVTNPKMLVRGKGFSGVSQMIKDGPRAINSFANQRQFKTFIICADADKLDSATRRRQIQEQIANKSSANCSIVIPTWEIEAWIMADINAARNIFGRWKDQGEIADPENIVDAKEHLKRLCRQSTSPPYNHATHNSKIIEHVDLEKVYSRCKSFRPLLELICDSANVRLPVKRRASTQ